MRAHSGASASIPTCAVVLVAALLSGCVRLPTEEDQRTAAEENAAAIKQSVTVWTGLIEYPRNSWERLQREECLRIRCLEPSRGPLLEPQSPANQEQGQSE